MLPWHLIVDRRTERPREDDRRVTRVYDSRWHCQSAHSGHKDMRPTHCLEFSAYFDDRVSLYKVQVLCTTSPNLGRRVFHQTIKPLHLRRRRWHPQGRVLCHC